MRQQKKQGDNENRVDVVSNDDLLVSYDENVVNFVCDESILFVGFVATPHVTPNNYFLSYTLGNYGMLKIGNNHRL